MNVNTPIRTARSVQPYRPIQYLGNKLRVIEPIIDMTADLVESGRQVADLFTGTSVVAQALAAQGYATTAVDTQRYAVTIANAMLGVARKAGETLDPEYILSRSQRHFFYEKWYSLVEAERSAVERADFDELVQIYASLPLLWRTPQPLNAKPYKSPIVTEVYSGTYFGVEQSLELDCLRHTAETLYVDQKITSWQYHAALTAILSAASSAVNSAGKHFAQPLLSGKDKTGAFHRKRLIQDRRISVRNAFRSALIEINARPFSSLDRNWAVQSSAEDFVLGTSQEFGLFYLDPPYTAQQYSRFYHLLETLIEYKIPDLSHNGKMTSGIYPNHRYKSAFSSKSRALPAFDKLLAGIKRKRGSALISYSASSENSNGNSRMVSLNELLDTCVTQFGKSAVRVIEMTHRYRQFNSVAQSNIQRDDRELLIECKTS